MVIIIRLYYLSIRSRGGVYGEPGGNLKKGSPPRKPFTHRHSERFVGNGEPSPIFVLSESSSTKSATIIHCCAWRIELLLLLLLHNLELKLELVLWPKGTKCGVAITLGRTRTSSVRLSLNHDLASCTIIHWMTGTSPLTSHTVDSGASPLTSSVKYSSMRWK